MYQRPITAGGLLERIHLHIYKSEMRINLHQLHDYTSIRHTHTHMYILVIHFFYSVVKRVSFIETSRPRWQTEYYVRAYFYFYTLNTKALRNWKISVKVLSKRLQKLMIITKRLIAISFVNVND